MYCWSLACRILSITLLACEMSAIVWQLEHCLALPFFVIELKNHLFQSCGHCSVFQICWHVECSTFTASSFRTWNGSAGILSPPVALFILILPKTHLILDSRMSGSRWVITPSWLFGSWRYFFVYFFCLFLPPFLNNFYFFMFIPFLSFIVPIFAWNIPSVSLIFLKRSLVFLILISFLFFFFFSL